jgi:hypothetical protein
MYSANSNDLVNDVRRHNRMEVLKKKENKINEYKNIL